MDDIPDLCRNVFPWISNQATRLGLETQDNRFAQLGGELFILTQQLPLFGPGKFRIQAGQGCSARQQGLFCK